MSGRFASDDEVATWQEHGWVLLDALIPIEEIDAVLVDLAEAFPTAEEYHADPPAATQKWRGQPPASREAYVWPPTGPGFRPEQHHWTGVFPFPGTGALNRLCVHPAIVDFAERALRASDLRLYQAGISAKYTGYTNYEQPMHTDRNHSWLPPKSEPPWLHLESFVYLSDVDEGNAPTHLVSVRDSVGHKPTEPLVLPKWDPGLYAAEKSAGGVRGSLLAYRPDVFHRGVNLTAPGGSRFLLNVSYKHAGQDWIGYHVAQCRSADPAWDRFVEGSTPRQLELLGFPPPGHPIWDADFVEATALRYPNLDLRPWRDGLGRSS